MNNHCCSSWEHEQLMSRSACAAGVAKGIELIPFTLQYIIVSPRPIYIPLVRHSFK